ncbi:MAG: ATP-binding protein [Lachnospiraceae bacterium]
MNRNRRQKALLKNFSNFLIFFLLVAFVITCCLMLFVTTLQTTLGVTFTQEEISVAAKATLTNVILISLLFSVIDALRRKFTLQRPVKKITEATEKMIEGDFSVRIKPISKFASDDTFNDIINCINRMAEELGSVETLRTDFIANVSHEMKTPLAVIQNYGTLLQASDLPKEKRIEYAKGVTDGSRKMADMMVNILKLNRLENQQIFPQTTEFNLGEQICECLLQYENIWENAGIEIETDIADDIYVKADAELLGLVWNNLFSNAFKFTETGGSVSVILTADDKYAIIKVKDTGCGISPDVGAHIFEKFYQGDTSHSVQGNGLGLALVKRVIDIMKGEISVESTVNVGTTFTVKILREKNAEQ